jgi:hypothetical protein
MNNSFDVSDFDKYNNLTDNLNKSFDDYVDKSKSLQKIFSDENFSFSKKQRSLSPIVSSKIKNENIISDIQNKN